MTSSPFEEYDFLSGHTIFEEFQGNWNGRRTESWNLIFTCGGEGVITYLDQTFHCSEGSLALIAPGQARSFSTKNNWDLYWFHFFIRPHIMNKLHWNKCCEGFYDFQVNEQSLSRVQTVLEEAYDLDMKRSKGWHDLAYNLIENVLLRGNSCSLDNSSDINQKISRAQELLVADLYSHEIDDLPLELEMSRSSFYDNFKRIVGIPPQKYRETHQLRTSCNLLETTGLSIAAITHKVGFANAFYFSNRFKKIIGISPTSYRNGFLHNKA